MPFLRRQLVTAALTANAIRPVPGFRAGIPSFAAGWLTSELATHLFTLTASDTAAHLHMGGRRRRRSKAGLALAAANLAGQAFLLDQARRPRIIQNESNGHPRGRGRGRDHVERASGVAREQLSGHAITWWPRRNQREQRRRERQRGG